MTRDMMRTTALHCLAAVLVLLSSFGCSGESCGPEDELIAYKDAGGLRLMIVLDKPVYGIGEPVSLTFLIMNRSKMDWHKTFPNSGVVRWDVYCGKEKVFTWNKNYFTTAAVTKFDFAPGGSKIYSFDYSPEAWDQKDDRGSQVRPGEYEIEFRLHELPEPYRVKKDFLIESTGRYFE